MVRFCCCSPFFHGQKLFSKTCIVHGLCGDHKKAHVVDGKERKEKERKWNEITQKHGRKSSKSNRNRIVPHKVRTMLSERQNHRITEYTTCYIQRSLKLNLIYERHKRYELCATVDQVKKNLLLIAHVNIWKCGNRGKQCGMYCKCWVKWILIKLEIVETSGSKVTWPSYWTSPNWQPHIQQFNGTMFLFNISSRQRLK